MSTSAKSIQARLLDLVRYYDTDFGNEETFSEFTSLVGSAKYDPSVEHNLLLRTVVRDTASGALRAVAYLIADPRVNPADWGNAALVQCHESFSSPIRDLLMGDKRVTPDESTRLLQLAIIDRDTAKVKELITRSDENNSKSRCDPGAFDSWALRAAVFMENIELVDMLVTDSRVDAGALESEVLFQKHMNHAHIKINMCKVMLSLPNVDPGARDNALLREELTGKVHGCSRKVHGSGDRALMMLLCEYPSVDPSIENSKIFEFLTKDFHPTTLPREVAVALFKVLAHPRIDLSKFDLYWWSLMHFNTRMMDPELKATSRLLDLPTLDVTHDPQQCVLRHVMHNGLLTVLDKIIAHPKTNLSVVLKFVANVGLVDRVVKLLENPRCDPTADDCAALWLANQGKVLQGKVNPNRRLVVELLVRDPRVRVELMKREGYYRQDRPLHNLLHEMNHSGLVTLGCCLKAQQKSSKLSKSANCHWMSGSAHVMHVLSTEWLPFGGTVPVGQLRTAEELDAIKPADYCELTRNWGQKRYGRNGNKMVMRMVGPANKWDDGQVFVCSTVLQPRC
jgi:hypothetical protein